MAYGDANTHAHGRRVSASPRALGRRALTSVTSPGERDEARAEQDRAVEVRPEDDERQRQEDAARRPARIVEQEPQRRGEQGERERLGPHDEGDRVEGEESRDRDPRDGARRRAVPAGDECRAGQGCGHEQRVDEKCELDAAGAPEPVQAELGEPLLVGPALAVGHDREGVVRRKAVLHDPATGDQRQPSVSSETAAQSEEKDDREHGQDDDQETVLLERAGDSGRESCPSRWSPRHSFGVPNIRYVGQPPARRRCRRPRRDGESPVPRKGARLWMRKEPGN